MTQATTHASQFELLILNSLSGKKKKKLTGLEVMPTQSPDTSVKLWNVPPCIVLKGYLCRIHFFIYIICIFY